MTEATEGKTKYLNKSYNIFSGDTHVGRRGLFFTSWMSKNLSRPIFWTGLQISPIKNLWPTPDKKLLIDFVEVSFILKKTPIFIVLLKKVGE